MRFFSRLTELILSHTLLFTGGVILITLFFLSKLLDLRIDFTIEKLFSAGDPEVAYYFQFRELFEREDRVIFLAFAADSIFNEHTLTQIAEMTERISSLEGIETVLSLTNLEVIRGDSNGVNILCPYEEYKAGRIDPEEFKNLIVRDSLWIENIISRNLKSTGLLITIQDEYNYDLGRAQILKGIRSILSFYQEQFYLAGLPVIRTEYVRFIWRDWSRFIPIIMLIMSLIALSHFRALVPLLTSILIVLLAIIWTLGLMSWLNISINIISYLTPILIVVVGISDSIHIYNRFREELKQGGKRRSIIVKVMGEIGNAICLTSFTTAVGFASLSVTGIQLISEFGLMVAIGVIFALVLSLVLLPIVLLKWKQPESILRNTTIAILHNRFLQSLQDFIPLHHKKIIKSILTFFGLSFFLSLGLSQDIHFLDDIHKKTDLYRSFDFVNRNLGKVFPFEIVLDSGEENGITSPLVLEYAVILEDHLRKIPEIGKVTSITDYIRKINQEFHGGSREYYRIPRQRELISQYLLLYTPGENIASLVDFEQRRLRISARIDDCGSQRMNEIVTELRDFIKETIPEGLKFRITGTTMLAMKTNLEMVNTLFYSFSLTFLVVGIMIVFLFRSIQLSLLAIIPNILPFIFLAGFMGLTGIRLRPSTAVTFAIAFGIAVDDTIHFVARFRREIMSGNPLSQAVLKTISSTGYAIIVTSEILILGISVLLLSSFIASQNFALLMGVTLLAALLGDILLLPAIIIRFYRQKQ